MRGVFSNVKTTRVDLVFVLQFPIWHTIINDKDAKKPPLRCKASVGRWRPRTLRWRLGETHHLRGLPQTIYQETHSRRSIKAPQNLWCANKCHRRWDINYISNDLSTACATPSGAVKIASIFMIQAPSALCSSLSINDEFHIWRSSREFNDAHKCLLVWFLRGIKKFSHQGHRIEVKNTTRTPLLHALRQSSCILWVEDIRKNILDLVFAQQRRDVVGRH